jgi:predicted regulator of Ras-like GTPase activity (Roadblock/LC7/MglB family)
VQEPGSRADRLAAALDEFVRSSPDVEAAAVVSFDGLPMASALPPELEEDRLGAMSAALLSLGEQAAVGLGRGMLNQIFVEGEHGFVFLMSARDQAVLTAIAARNAKIGFMLFEMRRAADRIGRALETSGAAVVAPEATVAPVDPPPAPPAPAASEPDVHGDAESTQDSPEDRSDEHRLDSGDHRPTWSVPHHDDAPGSEGAVHHLPPRSAASE